MPANTTFTWDNRKELLKEVFNWDNLSQDNNLIKQIRNSGDEKLKKYFSNVRISVLSPSDDSMSAFVDGDHLINELDELDDQAIRDYERKFDDHYALVMDIKTDQTDLIKLGKTPGNAYVTGALAKAAAHQNTAARGISSLTNQTMISNQSNANNNSQYASAAMVVGTGYAIDKIANVTDALQSILTSAVEVESEEDTTSYFNLGVQVTLITLLIGIVGYIQRDRLAAGVKYCKDTLAHTLHGAYQSATRSSEYQPIPNEEKTYSPRV